MNLIVSFRNFFGLSAFLLVIALFLATTIIKGQNFIDSRESYLDYLTSLRSEEIGLIIRTNGRCGDCLLAKDSVYLTKLDSISDLPFAVLDSESEFGQLLSMKHRMNKYPSILAVDQSGQLLRRINELPRTTEEIEALKLPFDTLPKTKSPLNFEVEFPEFYKRSFDPSAPSTPGDEVLTLFFQLNPDLRDEAVWAVVIRFDPSDKVMNKVIAQRDTLISFYGRDELFEKLDGYFFDALKAAAKSGNTAQFETVIAKAELAFGRDAFEYTRKYKSYFYQLTGNWTAYMNLGNEIHSKNQPASQTLMDMAEVLLRYSNDQEIFSKAAIWFSGELTEENLKKADLRSILLWRGGDEAQAKKLASKIAAQPAYSPERFPYTASIVKE